MTTPARVSVAPDKYARGYDGPDSDAPRVYARADLESALRATYDTDAHMVAYVDADADAYPRINKSGAPAWPGRLQFECLIADVDNPDKQPWTDETLADAILAIENNPVTSRVGMYATAHGYRIIQPIATPIPVAEVEPYLLAWLDALTDSGIPVDMACKDWTRHFRLPNVLRDGEPYRSPYVGLDRMAAIEMPRLDVEPPAPRPERLPARADVGLYARAAAYAAKIPPAIQGAHGDQDTFRLACKLVRDFNLPDADALDIMLRWNRGCQPPWSERELESKIRSAHRSGSKPYGNKADERLPARASVSVQPAPSRAIAPAETLTASQTHGFLVHVLESEVERRGVFGRDLRIRYNDMTGAIELGGVKVTDAVVGKIRTAIELQGPRAPAGRDGGEKSLKFTHEAVWHALEQVADDNRYHPVTEYLESLEWDGQKRLDWYAWDVFDMPKDGFSDRLVKLWLVGAAARGLTPGCKMDTVLVLLGPQGASKSTWCEVMGGEWYVSQRLDPSSKDAQISAGSSWIFEWSEMDSFDKREVEAYKAFLTSRQDSYRPPYGRTMITKPRTCAIAATTNTEAHLHDSTGNRRFWTIRVPGNIRLDVARETRDQVWAEAVHLVRAGEKWWLDGDGEKALASNQVQYSAGFHDPIAGQVMDVANGLAMRQCGYATIADIWVGLDKPLWQVTRADQMRLSAILKAHGWFMSVDKVDGRTIRTWKRGDR